MVSHASKHTDSIRLIILQEASPIETALKPSCILERKHGVDLNVNPNTISLIASRRGDPLWWAKELQSSPDAGQRAMTFTVTECRLRAGTLTQLSGEQLHLSSPKDALSHFDREMEWYKQLPLLLSLPCFLLVLRLPELQSATLEPDSWQAKFRLHKPPQQALIMYLWQSFSWVFALSSK